MNDERWVARQAAARAGLSRREALIGGTFLAAAAAGLALQPRDRQDLLGAGHLERMVPTELGPWRFNTASGLVLPPADQLRDAIYSQLVTRTYVRDGFAPVMLLIAYSGAQDGTIQIHRPEVCYPASGFHLSSNEPHLLAVPGAPAVPARAIVANTEVRREQLVYWTRLGSHFPTRWIEQRLAVTAENFAGIVPDGVLVRLSSVGDGDQFPVLDAFARLLVAGVGRPMRRVLLGPAAG